MVKEISSDSRHGGGENRKREEYKGTFWGNEYALYLDKGMGYMGMSFFFFF